MRLLNIFLLTVCLISSVMGELRRVSSSSLATSVDSEQQVIAAVQRMVMLQMEEGGSKAHAESRAMALLKAAVQSMATEQGTKAGAAYGKS